jgi:hypothetical protein
VSEEDDEDESPDDDDDEDASSEEDSSRFLLFFLRDFFLELPILHSTILRATPLDTLNFRHMASTT